MKEIRDHSARAQIYELFLHPDPESLLGLSRTSWQENGFDICEVEDIKELNVVYASIKESIGSVQKIESRYPSLEEIRVKIGKY
jgi:ABC-2 type transport system ATP-binding protein